MEIVTTVWEYDSPETISPMDSNNSVSGVVAAPTGPITSRVNRDISIPLGGKPRVPGARTFEFSAEEVFPPFEFVDHGWFDNAILDSMLDFMGVCDPSAGQHSELGRLVDACRFGKPYG